MWAIERVINHTSPQENIAFSDGLPINAVRGPAGASFRLIGNDKGFLDITDSGHQPGGPHFWQLNINGNPYWYDGQGAIALTIDNDGSYTVSGDGNQFSGQLLPLPHVVADDIVNFDWMIQNNYVPYQNIPDAPGKTTAEIEQLGRQYFPYSANSFQLAMSLYDWTTADFTRIDFMRIFTYSGVRENPLAMNGIAEAIWSADWPPYTPQNADYMNSFMMVPADSLQEVQSQLDHNASTLKLQTVSESNIIVAALQSLPRTSCLAKPALYSGQVAISNLNTQHFASYFLELPANNDPCLPPLEMPLADALTSFMAAGKQITLKTFMSFTDSLGDAQHYSNGIVIILSPPDGAVVWNGCAYITPFSDGPSKTEYLFQPGCQFQVQNVQKVSVNGTEIVEIYLQLTS